MQLMYIQDPEKSILVTRHSYDHNHDSKGDIPVGISARLYDFH